MWKSHFASAHFTVKIIILLVLVLFWGSLSMIAYNVFTTMQLDASPNIALMQVLQSFGIFILPAIGTAYLCSTNTSKGLQWQSKAKWSHYLWVTAFVISAIPAINLLAWLNEQVTFPPFMQHIEQWFRDSENNAQALTENLLKANTILGLLGNLLLIAVLPAIAEELLFRGALQNIIQQWRGTVTAIWIIAIVFSAIHLQFYGFVPRMLLGALFGYMVYWSGGIGLAIWAHFVNNAIAVGFHYLQSNNHTQLHLDTVGADKSITIGILSLIVAGGLLFEIRKRLLRINN